MARDLHELTARLNRLRERKAELEALTGNQLATMPVARARAINREYNLVRRRIRALEEKLR